MRDACLLLLTPAALNQRQSRAVLERVGGHGFTPFRQRAHARLSPDAVTAVFQVNKGRIWDTYRYRVLDRLFQAGPAVAVQALGFLEGGSGLPLVYVSPTPGRCAEDAAVLVGSGPPESPEEIALVLGLLESGSPRAELDRPAVLGRLRCAALLGAWADLDALGRRLVEASLDGGGGMLADPAAAEALVAHLRGGERHLLADLLRHDFRRPRPGFAWWRLARALAVYGAEPSVWDELTLLGGMVEA